MNNKEVFVRKYERYEPHFKEMYHTPLYTDTLNCEQFNVNDFNISMIDDIEKMENYLDYLKLNRINIDRVEFRDSLLHMYKVFKQVYNIKGIFKIFLKRVKDVKGFENLNNEEKSDFIAFLKVSVDDILSKNNYEKIIDLREISNELNYYSFENLIKLIDMELIDIDLLYIILDKNERLFLNIYKDKSVYKILKMPKEIECKLDIVSSFLGLTKFSNLEVDNILKEFKKVENIQNEESIKNIKILKNDLDELLNMKLDIKNIKNILLDSITIDIRNRDKYYLNKEDYEELYEKICEIK